MQTKSSPLQQAARRNFKRAEAGYSVTAEAGFSLIEVVLALGVVAFAFVALFGMLPVGLNAFNNSIDSTMETQIAETVISQVRQEKFSQLYTLLNDVNAGSNSTPVGGPSFLKPYSTPYQQPATGFYYDDQGNFLQFVETNSGATQNAISANTTAKMIYTASVQVYYDTWTVSGGITPPFGSSPTNPTNSAITTQINTTSPQQPFATVVVTVRKLSAPNVARIYTETIDNNGI